jgi:hypothetical protein
MCIVRSLFVAVAYGAAALAATLFARPAAAVVILSATGLTGGPSPVPLAAEARLSLSGTTLTIVLSNESPGDSTTAEQMLSSFYFDVVKDGVRPPLAYESARGLVWKLVPGAADQPFNYAPPAMAGGPGSFTLATGTVAHVPSNLVAVKNNDRTWQFRSMDAAAAPFLGFGIGTVGNSDFAAGGNGFTPSIVGPPGNEFIAFSVYSGGDIQPGDKPVTNQFFVRDSATFTFSSPKLAGFTEAHISRDAAFGFGTGPDTVLAVPEPTAALLAASGGIAWAVVCRRRRAAAAAPWRGSGRCTRPPTPSSGPTSAAT